MAGDPGLVPVGAKGMDISGAFAVSCRHIIISPTGVVNFELGER